MESWVMGHMEFCLFSHFFFMDTNRGLVHTLPKYYAPKRLYCLMVYLLLYFKLSLTLYSGILVTGWHQASLCCFYSKMSFRGFNHESTPTPTPHSTLQHLSSSFSSIPPSSPTPIQSLVSSSPAGPAPSCSLGGGPSTDGYPLLKTMHEGKKKLVRYPDPSEYETAASMTEAIEEFYNWWNLTPAAVSIRQKQKTIPWHNLSHPRPSKSWENFTEVALQPTGSPFVRCKSCHELLHHPVPERHGTKGLSKHLESRKCSFNKSTAQGQTQKIDHFLAKDKSVSHRTITMVRHFTNKIMN